MTDNVALFDRYSHTAAAEATETIAADETPSQDNKPAYKAFQVERTKAIQTALRILYQDTLFDKDATEEAMPYPLTRVVASSHQYISIYCSDGVIINLEGRNLKALMEPLQDGQVRLIQRFHEGKFQSPGEDEPIITGISRTTMREMMGG